MKNNFTRVRVLVLAFTFLLVSLYGTAATITVSSGQSIQNAVNQANPGDIVQVNAGTYAQKVLFSGSADDGVTLRANGTVILNGTNLSPNGREGLITISNSDNVRVEGFTLRNFKTTGFATPVGILVDSGSDNVELINNTIHNIENNRTNCNQNNDCYVGAHGIGVFGNTTNAITNILIQGNEVYNCDLMSSEAFVLNGNVNGFQIYDNIVRDNDNIGFDFIGYEPYDCSACSPEQTRVKNGLVAGNQAYRNSSGNNPHYTGDKSAGGFYVDGGRNIMFAGNISYENDFGFEFASEWNNRKTENILMVNNLVYNNTVTGLVMGGYSASTGNTGNGGGGGSAENIYVYNNTFYNNQAGSSYYATEVTFQYRVKNSRFYNNIFYTKGNTSDIYNTWCGTCGNSNTGNSWSKNVWFGDQGTSGAVPGTNNIKSNPQFTTTGSNFTLKSNSPAINAGSTQSNLTNWTASYWDGFFYANGDIPAHGTLIGSTVVDGAGNNRFQGTIDAGAYEYGSGGSGALPSPWATTDIGSVGASGSASYSGTTFTVKGSGADIWGTKDEFRYVYQRLRGDGEIVARVNSLTNTDTWAKAGIMIREYLSTGSKHASLVMTPSSRVSFQRRTATNNNSAHTTVTGQSIPKWLKLVRSGNSFSAFYSSNGSSWTKIGSTLTISMVSNVWIGLCVTSHNDGTLATANINNVSVSSGGSSSRLGSSSEVLADEDLVSLSVYPNPASNVINITGVVAGQNVRVFDMLGNQVLETTDAQINITSLKPGIYLLKPEGQHTLKFIKN